MPIDTPASASETIDRIVADVELALAEFGANPALRNSWLRALMVAFGNRVFDFYFALNQAALEALPDTAVDNLERWATIYGIARISGAVAAGNVIASGLVGSVIPVETVLTSGEGKQYRVVAGTSISTKSLVVSSITRSGSTATLTTAVPHELGSQVKVTVTGANEPEYNVVGATATIVANDQIEYQVTGTPATPATGTILLGFDSATLSVESVEPGDSENQAFDAALKLESPIAGVDDVARVDFDEVGGGSDQETIEELRLRLLERIQNPVAHFNVAEIVATAKTVAGVTRVFVQEITPDVGQVTIYFMRDNDDTGPIPSGSEVAAVDAVIQAIRPANSDSADVFVLAPTPVSIDFTFTALSPNTATMKDAIEANLRQFFAERTSVGADVLQDAYRSAIFNTLDPVTGDEVASFTLSAPSGDQAIAAGEIGILGNVVFP